MNLLREVLERIEFERLIEEGRDPVEVLHYKYQNVPTEVIDDVVEIDPTKKKSFSQWLLSKWDDEKNTIIKNLKNGRIAKLFQHYKNHNDIQIKDCPSVEEGLRLVPEEDTVLTKSTEPMTYVENLKQEVDSDLANDFDVVFHEDNWLIAVPHTYEAECKLGENMRWCTANGFGHDGRSYYNNYLSNYGGEYYVNFDMSRGEHAGGKDYPYTRYQFHFESHQYCDSHDDRVSILEIGMPDSAIGFYEGEGHSMDEDELMDEEERQEVYYSRRNADNYALVEGELYLMQEYDENYNFEEANENTAYYIYDANDDTDPICYEGVPNPHIQDVVRTRGTNYIILAAKYGGGSVIAVNETEGGNYRTWQGYKINAVTDDDILVLPDDLGIFASDGNQMCAYTIYGMFSFPGVRDNEVKSMFINEALSYNDINQDDIIFVEVVKKNGFHSLVSLDLYNSECECIIRNDEPLEGEEFFTTDENGIARCVFRNYRVIVVDDNPDYEGQPKYDCDVVKKLEDGTYVISMEKIVDTGFGTDSKILENIVRDSMSEPILESWVYSVEGIYHNTYMTNNRDYYKSFFRRDNGKRIGEEYYTLYRLDEEKGIIAGHIGDRYHTKGCHIIDTNSCRIIGKCAGLITKNAVNNMVVVSLKCGEDAYQYKIYNYITGELCYPEFEDIKRISDGKNNFYCKVAGKNYGVIFDFDTQRITANYITDLKLLKSRTHFLKLTKADGKMTIYDWDNSKEYLKFGVDSIEDAHVELGLIDYQLNGRYYLYNFKNDSLLLSENGFDYPFTIADYETTLKFFSDTYYVVFSYSNFYDTSNNGSNIKGLTPIRWGERNNYYGSDSRFGGVQPPPEVIEMTNRILAQIPGSQLIQQQPQQAPIEDSAYAFTEQVKRMIKRIDEAMKLKYNDIID